jgi:plasmid stabilization system protein ParE
MSKYRVTPQALDDLFEIWTYIAQENSAAAYLIEDATYLACEFLAQNPLAGHTRKDLTPLPVRFWPVQGYPIRLIVYDPQRKPLEVIRILHGARNIPAILNKK